MYYDYQNINGSQKNPIITTLNHQKSQFDDDRILKGNFTRSPMHAITFLIVYAGLDDKQRQYSLKNLNNKNINKNQLDKLILALLQKIPESILEGNMVWSNACQATNLLTSNGVISMVR